MALINCPECNNQVSDKAENCPNCGFPIQRIVAKNQVGESGNKTDVSVPKNVAEPRKTISKYVVYFYNRPVDLIELQRMSSDKNDFIKRFRSMTGAGLKDASDIVEAYLRWTTTDRSVLPPNVYDSIQDFSNQNGQQSMGYYTGVNQYQNQNQAQSFGMTQPRPQQGSLPTTVSGVSDYHAPKAQGKTSPVTMILLIAVLLIFIVVAVPSCSSDKEEEIKKSSVITDEAPLTETTENIEVVPYFKISHDVESYVYKTVQIAIIADYVSSDYITAKEFDFGVEDYNNSAKKCRVEFPEIEDLDISESVADDDYIVIQGTVAPQDEYGYEFKLTDSKIICVGESAKVIYDEDVSTYDAWKTQRLEEDAAQAAEDEETFRAEAEEVSYEDLERYPDSYKDKKIKVTLSISEVEPDGWVLAGTIWAKMGGSELIVVDDRKVAEPKMLAGDKVTIYGYGNGLATIKVKETGHLINLTVDEYTIPQVKAVYIDF